MCGATAPLVSCGSELVVLKCRYVTAVTCRPSHSFQPALHCRAAIIAHSIIEEGAGGEVATLVLERHRCALHRVDERESETEHHTARAASLPATHRAHSESSYTVGNEA